MHLVALTLLVAALTSPPSPLRLLGAVDGGTVQSTYVYELNPTAKCSGLLDRDGRVCGVSRRFELRGIDRTRVLALVNDNLKGGAKGCVAAPTHAVVFETTSGVRAIDVNFACHTIDGRALSQKAEREFSAFFRLYGMVNGLAPGI